MKKVVIVCGGSKGIGAAVTRLLIEKKFRVICVARTLGELADISKQTLDFKFIECDLASEESRQLAIDMILTEKNLWALVNNASGPSTGPLMESSASHFISAFNLHLFASTEFTKSLVPQFMNNGAGRIVNIISVTAKIPIANMGVSNTLRGAILNWSKTLSKELGPLNITVNNVLPGYTETQRLVEVINGVSSKLKVTNKEYSDELLKQVPMKRFGQPKEIAAVAAFLISEEASFVTGVSIPVDGGWTPCS
jgi:3-oxoacyl-[acyl-carrier protein] reductase